MRLFPILLMFVLAAMVGVGALVPVSASADEGEEYFHEPAATQETYSFDVPPTVGSIVPPVLPGLISIDLVNCRDGSIAKWRQQVITFRITSEASINWVTVESIRAGVLEWNAVGGPYVLVEAPYTNDADIEIDAFFAPDQPGLLGAAFVPCATGALGILDASVELYLGLVSPSAVRNVAAHEVGHALGLGHANLLNDLMSPFFVSAVHGTRVVCPSSLDVGGLWSNVDPYSVTLSDYSQPTSC